MSTASSLRGSVRDVGVSIYTRSSHHHQVVCRRGCRLSVMFTSHYVQTPAVEPVYRPHHRSIQGPGLAAVCEGRAHTYRLGTAAAWWFAIVGGRPTGDSMSETPTVRSGQCVRRPVIKMMLHGCFCQHYGNYATATMAVYLVRVNSWLH